MKNILNLLVLILTLSSCEKEVEPIIEGPLFSDTELYVKIVDSSGTNILDKVNGIAFEDIKLFYRYDYNRFVEHTGGGKIKGKGMEVFERNDEKYLSVLISGYYFDNNFQELKFQFSENDFDIIKTETENFNGSTICVKVWCNDVLRWEYSSNTERVLILTK